MKKVLHVIAALCFLSAGNVQGQTSVTLTLTASTKYQYIDGFGGAGMNGQWGDVYTQEKVRKLWGTGEGCIGLNIMRIRINPNEGNWGEYGNPIRWARALRPDLQVFATPWTPPKMYKTQNTTKYQNDFGTWVWPLVEHSWGGQGSNGGAINPDYYEEYADFLERYRATMEAKGCPIDMISIQNESDYTPTATDATGEHASYESCIYSPKEMAAMVKAARAKVDPKCKIMGPECFGWGQHNYNNTLVNMPDAVNNIDVWGNHLYGTNDWSFVNKVTEKTGKHMWMTEFLIDYPQSGYTGAFSQEYEMVNSIETAMKAGYNGYVYYNMLNDFFACNHGGSETELWKRAYVFGHYAKYATGKTRILSEWTNGSGALRGGSAYISESGDTVTVFVLNTSSTTTYQLGVTLPFKPAGITQMVTGDNVNGYTRDVTEKYIDNLLVFANGNVRARVQVLPNMFYTFQFLKNAPEEGEDDELATSPKQPSYGSPLSATQFMADPTALEHEGRLYVYATNDQQQFDYTDGLQNNNYSKITSLACLSTADLVNWTNHGNIDVKSIAPWISTSWAPSVVSRVEADGLTHFYLYFTNTAAGIGVLTATSPTGPWTDPLGHALIDSHTEGLGTISNIIDPGVAINDDGTEAYLTFGGGDVTGTELLPGNARIVKLGDDMISLASDIKTISAPCHFEANELNYIGGKWVFSYCTRWSISSEWSQSDFKKKTKPSAASIVYMTATDPLADAWTYQGVILPNPGDLGYPYGNNHSHLQKFNGAYLMLYHTQWLERELGFNGGYRNLQMARMRVTEGNASLKALDATTATIEGVGQLPSRYVNPYLEHPSNMAAIITKNWWLVRGVNFSYAQEGPARSLILKVKGTGTLSICPGALTKDPLVTAEFSGTEEQTLVVPLAEENSNYYAYLYFVKTGKADMDVLSWQFTDLTPEEVTGINDLAPSFLDAEADWYTLSGTKLKGKPTTKGVYIHGKTKVFIP